MIPGSGDVYKCLKGDILELRGYVDKLVRVSIKGGKTFEGVLYTIDPVSSSVVLYNECQNYFEFVFGHAIDKITILNGTEGNSSLFESLQHAQPVCAPHDHQTKSLAKLKNWLLQNRIPIEEVGNELKLGDVLTIIPPYNTNCCVSTNGIVLANVQRLIKTMPSN